MHTAEGESSGGEEETEAMQADRGCCGQFVWPCPRQYPSDAATRKSQKWFIPADMDNKEFGLLFQTVAKKLGQLQNISKLHVFDEPHKRYNKTTGTRERHKHLVFKVTFIFIVHEHGVACVSLISLSADPIWTAWGAPRRGRQPVLTYEN